MTEDKALDQDRKNNPQRETKKPSLPLLSNPNLYTSANNHLTKLYISP
jgi:hypothetical protein